MELRIVLPIRTDQILAVRSHPEWLTEALGQLCDLSGALRCSPGEVGRSASIAVVVEDASEPPDGLGVHPFAGGLLGFGIDADIVEIAKHCADQEIAVDWAISLAASDLQEAVEGILLATHIAMPGSVSTMDGVVVVDGKVRGQAQGAQPLIAQGVDDAARRGWPPIGALSIRQVHEWLSKLPGFDRRTGKGPVGRAVAALSHLLLNETDVPGDLIWAMIGLEALYGRDQAPVGTQLMRKAELLLGARKTHKRVMKEAYRFRSKLVHGEIDIPFFQNDPNEPDFAQFVQNNSDATLLAQAVLVASIQELIRRSEHVLEFEYTIARDGSGL
jgi:hypothetical protein